MYILEVGQKMDLPFPLGIDRYQFNYDKSGSELFICVKDLSIDDIKAVREGIAKFALSMIDEIIFLHFKITLPGVKAGFNWSECPYSIHFVDFQNQQLPERVPDNWGLICKIILVEGNTHIVEALRVFTFSNKFSLKLSEFIETQYFMPFNPEEYDRKLAKIYDTFSSRELLKFASVRCIAGVKD